MIKTDETYKYYLDTVEKKFDNSKLELTNIKKEKKITRAKLKRFEYFIRAYTNCDLIALNTYTRDFKLTSTISFNLSAGINVKDIKVIIDEYVALNLLQKEKESVIKDYALIPLKNKAQFNFILKEYNKIRVEKLIHEDIDFTIGKIGRIVVKRKKRRKLVPNWAVSNANKATLITNGELPYKQLDKDEDGNKIGNGGKAWMVYYESEYHPYFIWDTSLVNKEYKEHLKEGMLDIISFTPTKGDCGIVYLLNKAIKRDPTLLNKYAKI